MCMGVMSCSFFWLYRKPNRTFRLTERLVFPFLHRILVVIFQKPNLKKHEKPNRKIWLTECPGLLPVASPSLPLAFLPLFLSPRWGFSLHVGFLSFVSGPPLCWSRREPLLEEPPSASPTRLRCRSKASRMPYIAGTP